MLVEDVKPSLRTNPKTVVLIFTQTHDVIVHLHLWMQEVSTERSQRITIVTIETI